MHHPISGRYCAIQKLYQSLKNHQPGTRRYEEIEHALDLALSARRVPDEFFVRNVLRDSKRVLDRQRARVKLVSLEGIGEQDGEICEPYTPPELCDYTDPESILIQKDMLFQLVGDCAGNNNVVVGALRGLLKGETLKETARSLQISTDYVKAVRSRIRKIAAIQLSNRRAA